MRVQPPFHCLTGAALLCSACLEPQPTDPLVTAPSAAATGTPPAAPATDPAPAASSPPFAAVPELTPPVDNECPRVELFTNGSFDDGDTAWSQGSASWEALIVDATTAGTAVIPHSGTHFARLGGYLQTGQDALTGQDSLIAPMTVPEGATNIVFSYYSIVLSEEASTEPIDTLFMSLDSDVQYLTKYLNNTSVHAEWQRFEQTIDPSAAGKSVVILIRVENDASRPTTFLIDSMSLEANVCP